MAHAAADLIRAWRVLGADSDAERTAIAALLGFVRRSAARFDAGPQTAVPAAERSGGAISMPLPEAAVTAEARREILAREIGAREGPSQYEILGSETMETVSSSLPPMPRKRPLLEARWERGIFKALLAATVETRDVDTARILDAIARGERIVRMPWRREKSVSPGVRCFLDVGAGMQPFAADQAQLVGGLRLLFGDDRVTVGYFETLPDAADARFEEDTDKAASPVSPVLVVSDFGAVSVPGRRWALPEEWLEYIQRVRQSGASGVFALTPFGRTRLPRPLRGELVAVEWDRTTSVRSVVREGAKLAAA
jgi:hypothetical protein